MNEFIEQVLKNVKAYPEHNHIRKELEDHIETHVEYLMDNENLQQDEAISLAVKSMGDADALGREFNDIYPIYSLIIAIFKWALIVISSLLLLSGVYKPINYYIAQNTYGKIYRFSENYKKRLHSDEWIELNNYARFESYDLYFDKLYKFENPQHSIITVNIKPKLIKNPMVEFNSLQGIYYAHTMTSSRETTNVDFDVFVEDLSAYQSIEIMIPTTNFSEILTLRLTNPFSNQIIKLEIEGSIYEKK